MASALLLVLDYREAETVFTEPLLLGTVVGGDWGTPGLAASPKPQRLGCLGKPQSRSPAAGGLYADWIPCKAAAPPGPSPSPRLPFSAQ